jgi:hypothetical protein
MLSFVTPLAPILPITKSTGYEGCELDRCKAITDASKLAFSLLVVRRVLHRCYSGVCQVKQEFELESEWKQIGSVADGILRSVMEKRKQAELMMKLQSSPVYGACHAQFNLPLFSSTAQFTIVSRTIV